MTFGFGFGFPRMQGVGAFSPAALFASGEVGAWYDPSDLTTLFQDVAGTTPVTTPGQTVARINDKSGRGNHATQGIFTSQPKYQIDGGGRPYLGFDGVDDGLATGSVDFTATNKMTVFAGVRKLSDGGDQIILELSANLNANAGTFYLSGALSGTPTHSFVGKGSAPTFGSVASATGIVAPISSVLTGAMDISADLVTLRRNGAAAGSSAMDLGTGNIGNYPLFVGRRGGTSLPYNGNLYGLIVRGAATDAANITSTETWMNGKTGAY